MKKLILAVAALTLFSNSWGQDVQPGKTAVPVAMTECEGTNNCADWTFLGAQGNGQWPSGEIANLTVESYDDNSVEIRRADSTGRAAGLTALYKGTRHGDHVSGEFTSTWPGNWENRVGPWYAMLIPQNTPPVMHFCAANCFTLKWDKSHYVSTGDNDPNSKTTWTVESFTPQLVVLRRLDSSGFTGFYSGQISPDGTTLVNKMSNGKPSNYRLTWGAALNATPGNNAERDREKGLPPQQQRQVVVPVIPIMPVVCIPWFFSVVCG
jgi:hypothetical protein